VCVYVCVCQHNVSITTSTLCSSPHTHVVPRHTAVCSHPLRRSARDPPSHAHAPRWWQVCCQWLPTHKGTLFCCRRLPRSWWYSSAGASVYLCVHECIYTHLCTHTHTHSYIHSHTCVLMAKQPKSTQSSQSVLLNSLIALAAQISTLVAVPFLSSYAFLLLDGQVCVCVCVYVCVALIPHRYHVHVTPDTHTHTLYIYIHISRTA
jgi:hypothetical protein